MNYSASVVLAMAILATTRPALAQFGSLGKSLGALGARTFLKDPIDAKCTEAGLKSCADITEGLLLYVEDKAADGKGHLQTAAQANSPEQLKTFAQALVKIGDIPGAAKYMGPLLDGAKFLAASGGNSSRTSASTRSSAPAVAAADSGANSATQGGALSDADQERLLSGMVVPLPNPATGSMRRWRGLGALYTSRVWPDAAHWSLRGGAVCRSCHRSGGRTRWGPWHAEMGGYGFS